ncbi:MAG: amino acid adenylation domain-containing protein, partial [Litorilinea sp.]
MSKLDVSKLNGNTRNGNTQPHRAGVQGTQAEPLETTLHARFEYWVAATPDAIALEYKDQQLTYAQVNARADEVAAHLRAHLAEAESHTKTGGAEGQMADADPYSTTHAGETLIGICMEPSPEMLVGVLAILKAGAAYVPLDPAYPRDRLGFIARDAQIPLLLTQKRLLSGLPEHGARVICLDDLPPVPAADLTHTNDSADANGSIPSAAHTESHSEAQNLAYVIYTSGSTGKPKGVLIQHRSVNNLLNSMQSRLAVEPADRFVLITTLSFDISVLEIFLPLVTGARCIIAPRAIVADGLALCEWLDATAATVVQATPSSWRLVLNAGWQGASGLKILCGGEALSADLAGKLVDNCAELWNVYGPTETTIWSSATRIEAKDLDTFINIGAALDNTQLYVLDVDLQPVASGEVGELYIGGSGLARGYLNRPELTAERFVPNPFADGAVADAPVAGAEGTRMYRAGDLVRFHGTGQLEFAGRADSQVKIRGFRIELGEIETALVEHPVVEEAVVVAHASESGDKRLVAYVSSTAVDGAGSSNGDAHDNGAHSDDVRSD